MRKLEAYYFAIFKIIDLINTGNSLSEALIFASTNPQYDDSLFIELQVQYMKILSSNHSAKRRASDKDLLLLPKFELGIFRYILNL